jgi:hypothetical protein
VTEARSHLIRAGQGRVRVLRLHVDGRACWPLRYEVAPGQPWCRSCGCTNRFGCVAPHCCWANAAQTLCSRCAARIAR